MTRRSERLRPPEAVWRATRDYLDADDTLGEFLEEKCVVGPNHTVAIADLLQPGAHGPTAATPSLARRRPLPVGCTIANSRDAV